MQNISTLLTPFQTPRFYPFLPNYNMSYIIISSPAKSLSSPLRLHPLSLPPLMNS